MAKHGVHSKPFKGLQSYERVKIERDFGPTVAESVPDFPDRVKVTLPRADDPVEISLSRLECGCIAMIHPSFIDSLERSELDFILGTRESATEALATLLARAERGEHVDARDVVIAREAVELEKTFQTADARKHAELEARMKGEFLGARQDALTVTLKESHDNLRALQDDAYDALVALLDAAETHSGLAQDAADELEREGVKGAQRRGTGMTTEVVVGETVHRWWHPQQWSAGLLAAVHERHRLLGNSRWDRAELPRVYASTPRPSSTVIVDRD